MPRATYAYGDIALPIKRFGKTVKSFNRSKLHAWNS